MDKRVLIQERQTRITDDIMSNMRSQIDKLVADNKMLEAEKTPLLKKLKNKIKTLFSKKQ